MSNRQGISDWGIAPSGLPTSRFINKPLITLAPMLLLMKFLRSMLIRFAFILNYFDSLLSAKRGGPRKDFAALGLFHPGIKTTAFINIPLRRGLNHRLKKSSPWVKTHGFS
jgi:hypothetical protein